MRDSDSSFSCKQTDIHRGKHYLPAIFSRKAHLYSGCETDLSQELEQTKQMFYTVVYFTILMAKNNGKYLLFVQNNMCALLRLFPPAGMCASGRFLNPGGDCFQRVCIQGRWADPHWILWDTANKGTIRILLECILVRSILLP